MSATQTIAWFVIGAGTALAGYTGYSALNGSLPFGFSTPERGAEVQEHLQPHTPPPALASLPKAPPAVESKRIAPTFDVVRIEPNGVSVMAGQAAPNSVVSVLADGKTIATVRAQDDGGWSVAVEHGFATGDIRLSLIATDGEGGAAIPGQDVQMTIASTASAMARPHTLARATGLSTEQPETRHALASAFPAPVRFVYGEATFTAEGRQAAQELAEFIKREGLQTVTLSGHADERGSESYNMELSRLRLEAIARFLREQGFAGKLVLEPKGKSEPFTGIDRSALSREAVYALDRRVELRLTQ